MRADSVYGGSDGDLTRHYYAELERRGVIGIIAVNLFRAHKCSSRAKVYRGGGYRGAAYERKNWSMQNLCVALSQHSEALGITWGWKEDPTQEYHTWVLYIDLPAGQCSFHSAFHGVGPEYGGEWDGQHASAERILAFCDQVYAMEPVSGERTEQQFDAEPEAAAVSIKDPLSRPLQFGDVEQIAAAKRRSRSCVRA